MGKLKQPYLDYIGHDTEFFLWDTKKEKVVPSYKFFKTKAEEPKWSPALGRLYAPPIKPGMLRAADFLPKALKAKTNIRENSGGPFQVYRDGLAVEVNSTPVTCRAWIWQDMKVALATMQRYKKLPPSVKFTARPWVAVSPQLMRYFPEDLRILGCSPTFDAYTETKKVILGDPMKMYYRTSGAHMHASFNSLAEEAWTPIIKLSDLLLGLPFTYIFGDELEFKRRKLYGQAGEFQPQKYPGGSVGIEYRALSSRLYNHPGIFSLFFGIWKSAITSNFSLLWEKWDPSIEDDLREAINLGTPGLFPKLLEETNRLLNLAVNKYELRMHPSKIQVQPDLWDLLKRFNSEGLFPDAGIINNMDFAEAHKGWGEYSSTWLK